MQKNLVCSLSFACTNSTTRPSGVRKTRARVAAEYWLCTNRIQTRMHAMRMPFITFHGRNDVFVDPESSQLLYDKAGAVRQVQVDIRLTLG